MAKVSKIYPHKNDFATSVQLMLNKSGGRKDLVVVINLCFLQKMNNIRTQCLRY